MDRDFEPASRAHLNKYSSHVSLILMIGATVLFFFNLFSLCETHKYKRTKFSQLHDVVGCF